LAPGGAQGRVRFPGPPRAFRSSQQYHTAYDLNPLYRSGITGAGRTIVIVDSFGSPTIASDIKTFDAQFGLPPLNLTIDKFGSIPPFDPTN